jgi:hypothetical protein
MIKHKTRTLAGVLLRSGSTYREVSDALEISVGSVHNISREGMDYLEPLVTEMKRRSAFKCYLLADHTLSRMSDVDFERAGLKEKSVAAGILFDKATMLDGVMPKPDPDAWDQSKPGEMGRLYWPEGTSGQQPEEGHRYLLMKLFMQGRDTDALRIGRTVGMADEDIRECWNWHEEFDPPATQVEARLWKKQGKLRRDYDESGLPKDEEEKKERDWQVEKRELSRKFDDLYGLKPIDSALRQGGAHEAQAPETLTPAVPPEALERLFREEHSSGSSSQTGTSRSLPGPADERGEGVPETGRTFEPAPPEVGMRRVLNERFLNGLNALKAKMELNGIEQAVNAQLNDTYGKIPGSDEEN